MIYKCPICKKATDSRKEKEFPFCSVRRRMQDLGNWSSEKYVVSDPIFDEEELEKAEEGRKTIILDLNETDDTKH
ncbi:MAG TPA: DNA gyrase inhibitor YacG [Candidatus Eremiobacteraceae bacterium]|nr:DNA gyrase inhibitor YacG [Candidatus Eremiobacteraceae bacterium]